MLLIKCLLRCAERKVHMNTCQKLTSSANSFSTPPKKYTRRHSPLPGFLLEQILSSSTTTWQQFLLQHSLLLSPGPFRTPTEIPCPWLREAQHTWSLPLHYTIPPLFHTSPNICQQPHPAGPGRKTSCPCPGNTAVFCSTATPEAGRPEPLGSGEA